MKVITFSTKFPAKHPKAGNPTLFVEKMWQSIYLDFPHWEGFSKIYEMGFDIGLNDVYEPKHHTIRAGNRWKEGEWFSPRIWSGKPYASKQIEFAPPIQIKKIWEVCLNVTASEGFNWWIEGNVIPTDEVVGLSKNDGLEINDFLNWFICHPKTKQEGFKGQILCWNPDVEYFSPELPELRGSQVTIAP